MGREGTRSFGCALYMVLCLSLDHDMNTNLNTRYHEH